MAAAPQPATPSSGAEPSEPGAQSVKLVEISTVRPNPKQPRTDFAEQELQELAESIREHGVLQPILVTERSDNGSIWYEIVAGERRFRASVRAGLEKIPALVQSFDKRTALEVAIVENVQREQLTPVEEARAYQRLADEFGLTQVEIAKRTGKDRASVANIVRILKLSPEVLQYVEQGLLSLGHAKVLLSVREPSAQLNLARKVLDENLSVRALESIVARVVVLEPAKREPREADSSTEAPAAPKFPELERRLLEALGTKVRIKHAATGSGKIEVEYYSEQELERLVEMFSGLIERTAI